MSITLNVTVCETVEYEKQIVFKTQEAFNQFLVSVDYKRSTGEYNVSEIKKAANIKIDDVINYDNVGELYVVQGDELLEVFQYKELQDAAQISKEEYKAQAESLGIEVDKLSANIEYFAIVSFLSEHKISSIVGLSSGSFIFSSKVLFSNLCLIKFMLIILLPCSLFSLSAIM